MREIEKIYEMYSERECNKEDSEQISRAFEECERNVKSKNLSFVIESICDYGQEKEKHGFEMGFKAAMKLMTESFGV